MEKEHKFNADVIKEKLDEINSLPKPTLKELLVKMSATISEINAIVNEKIEQGGLPKECIFFIKKNTYPIVITFHFEVTTVRDCHS
jgi:hypothetical protein